MKQVFWYKVVGDTDRIEYLKKFSIAVIGSRMLMELLWRVGVGCIRYIGDVVTPVDVRIDCTIKPLEANDYDVVHPMSSDSTIISYLAPDSKKDFKRLLRGCDVVIAHKYISIAAEIAEEIGAPFIPDIITTFLPDGISFFEVEYPSTSYDPISYAITCSVQAGEVLRILTGYELPILAPEAYIVDVKSKEYLKRIELKVKR